MTLSSNFKTIISLCLLTLIFSCKKDKASEQANTLPIVNNQGSVKGYSLLEKLPGVYKGFVASSTSFGSFDNWIMDFRPIASSQIIAKADMTATEDIFLSFFIADYRGEKRIFFKNGGYVAGYYRASYAVLDSVKENSTESYYRFVDAVGGINKIYSEVTLKNDSLFLKSYTDKGGSQSSPVLHIDWKAKKQESTTTLTAINHFNYPKENSRINLTNAFTALPTSSTFFSNSSDVYKQEDHPYLGKLNVTVNKHSSISNKNIILFLSNKPLLNGGVFNINNLNYLTRTTFINSSINIFEYNYMHPGTHHLFAFYDADNNLYPSSGDWITSISTTININEKENKTTSIDVNFQIP